MNRECYNKSKLTVRQLEALDCLGETQGSHICFSGKNRDIARAVIRRAPGYKRILRALRLGDKIETVTKAFGVTPCSSCLERKRKLNGDPEEVIGSE